MSPNIDYRFNDIPVGFEKEPMLLLDTTASMNYSTSETDDTPRKVTVREAIGIIVEQLSRHDSQAIYEENGGGIRTITFSGGGAIDIQDLNSGNLKEKWAKIRFQGATLIVPGWNKLKQVYNEEFGDRKVEDQPLLMALVITDGEAEDSGEFATLLLGQKANIFVTVAVIGYGVEHNEAVRTYKYIADKNNHVRVIPFGAETDPRKIACTLLQMIE